MSFEPLELAALTDEDLAMLLEAMRALAQSTRNRVAMDLFVLVEREMLARHQSIEIEDYTDDEISMAASTLACAVDASRDRGVPDTYPCMQFLLMTITALITEAGRRRLELQ